MFNFHNQHKWAVDNPHAVEELRHEQQFSLNVWCFIVGDHLVGPYFLPQRLTGESYLEFRKTDFPTLLEDVPLYIRMGMYFMHDGAPPHFSRAARDYLDLTFQDRWIGRGGPILWSPRSPDLNPLDYFLWGHHKYVVYETLK